MERGCSSGESNVQASSLLHELVREGKVAAEIEKILPSTRIRRFLLEKDSQGNTPLHLAVLSGNVEVIKQLLSGAQSYHEDCIMAKNEAGKTPLHCAAASGKPEAVELLLDKIEEPQRRQLIDAIDINGALPFHYAARSGDVKSMQKLAPDGDVNVPCEVNGLTALHCAAANGEVDAVKHLLENGANLKLDKMARTPLHLVAISAKAAPSHRREVIEAILTKFPDSWSCADADGKIAIGCAYEHGNDDVVTATLAILRKRKTLTTTEGKNILEVKHGRSGATLFHYAAACGVKEDIEWMKKAAEAMGKPLMHDIILDGEHLSALHWAARKGNISTLQELTNAKSCTLTIRAEHKTPLFLALAGGHIEFAEELLECEKRLKEADKGRRLLLPKEWMKGVEYWFMDYYKEKVKEEVRQELEDGFKNHTHSDRTGRWLSGGRELTAYEEVPPVYLALHAERTDIAAFFQRLSSRDDSVDDAVNMSGRLTKRTTLHWAVLLHKPRIVEMLVQEKKHFPFSKKVRLCPEDAQGISPIQYATEGKMLDIEALLFKNQSVKDYIENLYKDRQIYVDSTNAILVGAALIASVTFASWLQPPLGFIDDHYDPMLHYVPIRLVKLMRIFWVFNSLSFFTAVATVQAGACGVVPLRGVHIGRKVKYIHRALRMASMLMVVSVICVLCAFGIAGFIVLPPKFKFTCYMMYTVIIGGIVNVSLLAWFIGRLFVLPKKDPLQNWIHELLQKWKYHSQEVSSLEDKGRFQSQDVSEVSSLRHDYSQEAKKSISNVSLS